MKTAVLSLLLGAAAVAATADTALPALYDVAGVAANDVLNLRQMASAASPIVGALPPDLTGVEVVEHSPDGKWGRVNQSDLSGWAALRFLQPQDRPAWYALQQDLQCTGTEPFWTLFVEPAAQTLHINTPEDEGPELDIVAKWPGEAWHPAVGVQFASEDGGGFAAIRAEACSDGMSDRVYGLTADVFLHGITVGQAGALRGCCTLVP